MKLVETNVPNILSQTQTQSQIPYLTQLSLSATMTPQNPIHPDQLDPSIRLHDRETIYTSLANNSRPYGKIPSATNRLSPFPVLLPRRFIQNLEFFNEALMLALENIVERWWRDEEAEFPARMPIDAQAEELLRVSSSYIQIF